MLVGGAQICITPPHPMAMGGYAAREGPATGTHDALHVRCLYFENDARARESGEVSVLVSYDVVGLPDNLVRRVKQRLNQVFGVPPERVALHATHTHSGPDLWFMYGSNEESLLPQYTDVLVAWTVSACDAAKQCRRTVAVCEAMTWIDGVGGVRRTGARSTLPLRVLGFIDERGKTHAAVVSFPCHPTVMGADNRHFSADYPGVCTAVVKALTGAHTVLFLTGAAGDISTRFTRRSQSFEEVDRFGTALGAAAASLLLVARSHPVPGLEVGHRLVTLPTPTRHADALLDALRHSAMSALNGLTDPAGRRVYETQLQGIEFAARHSPTTSCQIEASVTTWVFGDVAGWLFWPGEPFYGYDRRLKDGIGPHLTLVGYTDGMVGYIPDVSYEEDPAYEVLMSHCGKEGGEQLWSQSAQLYNETVSRLTGRDSK